MMRGMTKEVSHVPFHKYSVKKHISSEKNELLRNTSNMGIKNGFNDFASIGIFKCKSNADQASAFHFFLSQDI
jgi:S-adenosylmethionine/arginine decarboxylase-like enzyme